MNRHALKPLFSASSGVFLLAIRKYCCVEETPDYAKTKTFRVLRSFKMSYFCRYKEKNEEMLSLARLFDAVTAKRGLFKTVLVRRSYVYIYGAKFVPYFLFLTILCVFSAISLNIGAKNWCTRRDRIW